jgi:hypothetical protein
MFILNATVKEFTTVEFADIILVMGATLYDPLKRRHGSMAGKFILLEMYLGLGSRLMV